jgi:hypothetical protein
MFAPRVPGALVLVVGGLLASWLLQLGDHGVALVGEVPRGLPRFEVPDGRLLWDHVVIVAMAAFALMLIGFSQTAGDARAFAVKHHHQIDINQESVAQALANTGAGGLILVTDAGGGVGGVGGKVVALLVSAAGTYERWPTTTTAPTPCARSAPKSSLVTSGGQQMSRRPSTRSNGCSSA